MSAARRYKDVIGGMTEAVERLRHDDATRAAALEKALVELHDAMEAAADRAALSELGAALRWESALEHLWHEQWLTLSPLPKPDPRASPRDLEYYEAVVDQRYEALEEAIRKRALGRR